MRTGAATSRVGFTLIEILVTTVVLSTGIVMVLRAFNLGAAALGVARDRLWSTMLIDEKVSAIRAAVADGEARTIPTSASGRFEARYSDFRWESRCEVEPVGAPSEAPESGEAPELWRVTVTVWREPSERRISAATYVVVKGGVKGER